MDRGGRHRCWICKQEIQGGRTVIFTKIGFAEFICQTCYEKPNIQRILAGQADVTLSEFDVQKTLEFESASNDKSEETE